MSKKPTKRGPGKPQKEISDEKWAEMDKLAIENHQDGTIAVAMGWEPSFIEGRKDIRRRLRQKRVQGKIELKRAQREKGLRGDVTMLIWLGKQDLEQADKSESKVKMDAPGVVVIGGTHGGNADQG